VKGLCVCRGGGVRACSVCHVVYGLEQDPYHISMPYRLAPSASRLVEVGNNNRYFNHISMP